ncbi:hypothetical protein IscW_ISCW000376, partial [Ixodes scapularis]
CLYARGSDSENTRRPLSLGAFEVFCVHTSSRVYNAVYSCCSYNKQHVCLPQSIWEEGCPRRHRSAWTLTAARSERTASEEEDNKKSSQKLEVPNRLK